MSISSQQSTNEFDRQRPTNEFDRPRSISGVNGGGPMGPDPPVDEANLASIRLIALKRVAKHLRNDNNSLLNLGLVCKRFNNKEEREILIKNIRLLYSQSYFALCDKPSGWNKVYHMRFNGASNILSDSDVSLLNNIRELYFDFCPQLSDISPLIGVKYLTLYDCHKVTTYPYLPKLKELVIVISKITDVTMFSGLRLLHLENCPQITDVSPLKDVRDVALIQCDLISDVSSLGKVHKLWLYRLPLVTDVSALGGVHRLQIYYCDNIRDMSPIMGVHSLQIWMCKDQSNINKNPE